MSVRYRTLIYRRANDQHIESVVTAAYERFQQAMLATAGTAPVSQQVQNVISRTLQQLHTRIHTDPEWMNEIIRATRLPTERTK